MPTKPNSASTPRSRSSSPRMAVRGRKVARPPSRRFRKARASLASVSRSTTLFCKAALQASALDVAINTKLMTDRAHAAALDEKAARMLAEYVPLADEVYQSVASRLRA